FFRFMPKLIEAGYIYIAMPPLYKVQAGKKAKYAYSDDEKDVIIKEFNEKCSIQRYKGLGEMDPQQLWDTTMNPNTRTLMKVNIEDAIEADKAFSMLMGDDVEPRKNFIQENAQYADIDF
ncbi:MAG: DNA topoisomerase IV subunit B, partial [Anaeroplasmataceae bacterium]